jgi:hypothetical protein
MKAEAIGAVLSGWNGRDKIGAHSFIDLFLTFGLTEFDECARLTSCRPGPTIIALNSRAQWLADRESNCGKEE